MTRTRSVLVAAAVLAASLTACSPDTQTYAASDCEPSDLREYDTDCGYWDGDGTFTTWYWVTASGGYRPAGWHPVYPHGMSRPPNAKLTAPRHQPTPPGVKLYKPPAKSNTGSTSRRSSVSSVRGGRR